MIEPDHHWNLPPAPVPEIQSLARAAQVPLLIATVLYQRGFRTVAEIERFLNPSPALLNRPDTLPDINCATDRIVQALNKNERILVYGDYDCDGISGTAILVSVLKNLGGDALYYLPHRSTEGYGVSQAGVDFAIKNGVRLIITNDCGSADIGPITRANQAGIDVIVTDHHEPSAVHPPALAFVNPKRTDSSYPFRELAGAGVAFKLAWSVLAACNRPKQELAGLLDLAGLGTIADCVPLTGENRILAWLGLAALSKSTRPGIRALFASSRISPQTLNARDVSFGLAPRINAPGRIGHAETALKLLLTDDEVAAAQLAGELEKLNRSRQEIEETILTDALRIIDAERKYERRVMVLGKEGWNEGIIGIVAARLVERFWRPNIMISLRGQSGRGSGRSVSGFNLYAALKATEKHLSAFGGHCYAAGLVLPRQQIAPFEQAINEFACSLSPEIFQPTLHIDARADLNELNSELLEQLRKLQPFGSDNPEPIFATTGLEVVGYPRQIGKDKKNLKFKVRSKTTVLSAIAWGRSEDILNLEIGKPGHLDICYTITDLSFRAKSRNPFDNTNPRNQVQLNILDLKSSTGP